MDTTLTPIPEASRRPRRGLARGLALTAATLLLCGATAAAQATSTGTAGGNGPNRGVSAAAVMSLTAGAFAADDTPTTGAFAGGTAEGSSVCGGAPLPDGYGIKNGIPYSTHAPTGATYNPQGISLFVAAVHGDPHLTASQQNCLGRYGADAMVRGSYTKTFTYKNGTTHTARLFPYQAAFSGNPSLPILKPGWLSGLGQGSAMSTLSSVYDRTGDTRYLDYAAQAFQSFLIPFGQGGFVTEHNGLTYLQEYVTHPPSYVLNGDNAALGAVIVWYNRTKNPMALDLAQRVLRAKRTTAPLEQIFYPTGTATSYDLLRGWFNVPLRAAPQGNLFVKNSTIVDGTGKSVGSIKLNVTRSTGRPANTVKNSGFTAWSAGMPVGWSASGGSYGKVTRGTTPNSIRETTKVGGIFKLYQTLPTVKAATQYTVDWRAKLLTKANVPSSPTVVGLNAVCGGSAKTLAVADVRSTNLAEESISGKIPAGCAPQVVIYPADPTLPSNTEIANLTAFVADAVGAAKAPRLPISVLDHPRVILKVAYIGNGWVQGWVGGRWVTFGYLSRGNGGTQTAAITIPTWMQGRTVNLRYHNSHIREFNVLYHLTGDTFLRDLALEWLKYAPADEDVRAQLLETVPVNPDFAAVILA